MAERATYPDEELPPEERRALTRERVTMELYVAITLMAGLVFAEHGWDDVDIVGLVWGTTVGLAAAHWVAFSLAARFVDPDADRGLVLRQLQVQIAGAAVVATVASLAVLVAPEGHERFAAQIAVVGLVGFIVVRLGRSYGQPWSKCLRSAVVAVVAAALVAAVKEGLISE